MIDQIVAYLQNSHTSFLKILLLIVATLIAQRITTTTTRRIANRQKTARAKTLTNALSSSITISLSIIALLMILPELGINIMPLLASAGIAGFAIGFASQSLIKDVINGIYIITGDLSHEGDIIKISGIEGKIEKISIRTITLRDIDGVTHTIPNSLVTTIANYTKDWSRACLNIGVSNDHPIDTVFEIINSEISNMSQDPELTKYILDPPKLEITDINGTRTVIRILIKTKSSKQWDIERQLWYRLKKRFEDDSIKFAG